MTTDFGAKLLNKNGRVTRGITLPAVAKSAHSHRFILHTIYMHIISTTKIEMNTHPHMQAHS